MSRGVMLATALALGCSEGADGDEGGPPGTSGGAKADGEGSSGAETAVEVLAEWDASRGQLIEGIAVVGGTAYIGQVVTGMVEQVDLATGAVTGFGAFALPEDGTGILTGMEAGNEGVIYGAIDVFVPGAVTSGIQALGSTGGMASPLAGDAMTMPFPNGLEPLGDVLLVTDSASGRVLAVDRSTGEVSTWLSDPLLAPDPEACPIDAEFSLGANGVAVAGGYVYVSHTDRGAIYRAAIHDGDAGDLELFVGPDCDLQGADGLAVRAATDELFMAVNYMDRVVRVATDGTVASVHEGEPLQSPASLAWAPDGRLLVVNAAFARSQSDPASARPNLAAITVEP